MNINILKYFYVVRYAIKAVGFMGMGFKYSLIKIIIKKIIRFLLMITTLILSQISFYHSGALETVSIYILPLLR